MIDAQILVQLIQFELNENVCNWLCLYGKTEAEFSPLVLGGAVRTDVETLVTFSTRQ